MGWWAVLLIGVLASALLPLNPLGAQVPEQGIEDEATATTAAGEATTTTEGPAAPEGQPDTTEPSASDPVAPEAQQQSPEDQTETDTPDPPVKDEGGSEAPAPPPNPARQAEAAVDGPIVTPLSANPPNTYIRGQNVFYAYVEAGESLDVLFTKVQNGVVPNTNGAVVTIDGPGGVTQQCEIVEPATFGDSCAFSGLTSGTSGIWRIDMLPNAVPGGGSLANRYSWAIDVNDGGTAVDGRVWTEHYGMNQNAAETTSFTFWYQSEHGFLYEATYSDFNGINSNFTADAVGVANLDTCVSAYESMDQGAPPDFPSGDEGRLWWPALDSPGECGDPYKIFFENPDPALPETASLWDGSTVWLQPPVTLPQLSNLAFTPDSATTRSGEFTVDVTDFTGQLEVQVDVNNDGDYGDPEDRTIPVAVTQDGTVTAAFDGLDGLGNPIPATQDLGARVAIDQVGEIHFTNLDVETRGGLEVQALNGPDVGSTTVYWNDTALETAGRTGTVPPLDGRAGVDSTGGVHGWVCSPIDGGPPAGCNANDGVNGGWGDARAIDDWTYQTIDEIEELQIPGEPLPPLTCASDAFGYLFQTPGAPAEPLTDVIGVNLVTGASSTVADDIATGLNGVAYNVLDDYMYAFSLGSTPISIVRIGDGWSVENLGLPANWATFPTLPAALRDLGPTLGEIAADGSYWVARYVPGGYEWAQIDMDPASPTFFEVLDAGSVSPPAGVQDLGVDWSYNVNDGHLYLFSRNAPVTSPPTFSLTRFDTTSHTLETAFELGVIDHPAVAADPTAFGATYADSDGFIYGSENTTGGVWRTNMSTGDTSFFAAGPPSPGNDGARCYDAPVPIDFGDAPDSYGTTVADDGPRHAVPGYDTPTNTAPLMLGSTIDIETDGFPSTGADGDDTDNADDEDGVASPIVMAPGQPTTVSVTATNDSTDDAILVGWIDVDGSGTFDAGELVQQPVPAGSGTASYDLAFPAGTATADTYARFRLFPADVDPADILPTGPASAGEVEDHPVLIQAYEVVKTADPASGTPVGPGGTVTYTVEVTNIGSAEVPGATFSDDLSGVIDDATYNGDESADLGTVSYSEPTITWTGDLAPGEVATITYSVTVLDPAETAGDASLANAVTGGQCPDPPITDPQDPAFDASCVTVHPVESVKVAKASDPADDSTVAPGDTVTYTVTITNDGAVDVAPTVTDDLSGVLDDASYNGDVSASAGSASVLGDTLTWTGPLPVGATVTVTYSVTVLDPAGTDGDAVLENVVTGGQCPDPPITDPDDPDYDPGCHNIVRIASVQYQKVVSGADVEELQPGDSFTYTVTATNTGSVDLTGQSFTDDLSGVLDDATYNDDESADIGAVSYTEPTITWTGDLAVGEVATVTYSVTIDDPVEGDSVLVNGIVSTGGNCVEGSLDPACGTRVPQPQLETVKTLLEPSEPQPGDTATYQIVVTNVGQGPALQEPVIDDLSGVLDDATYNDDATVDPATGTLSYTAPEITWVGDIGAGESITITYSVTLDAVDELGDGTLENAVVGGGCPSPPVRDPQDPGFDPDCVTITPIPEYVTDKSSDAEGETVAPGDVVTYTVTLTNTGGVDLEPTITDDLAGVLDDASWNDDAAASAGDPPSLVGTTLTWTGPLGVGETVTLTYSVTVNASDQLGDGVLDNAVVGTGPTNCPEPPVTDPAGPGYDERCVPPPPLVGAYTVDKTAEPADGTARPGETVTYTVEVVNTGGATFTADDPASFTDDLSGVLDDATFDPGSVTVDPAGAPLPSLDGTTLSWAGPLGVGETVTVTYSMTVNEPDTGDHVLDNVVVTPIDPVCEEDDETCRTITRVPDLESEKVADTTDAVPGSTVTYTITLTNVGEGDYTDADPASFTDDLSGVLDDAVYNDDAAVDPDVGTLDYTEPVLSWSGPLAAGDSVTVTYTATVNDPPGGDTVLRNTVVTPEGNCVEGSGDPRCTPEVGAPVLESEKTGGFDDAIPGGTATYTVTLTNAGEGDFTDEEPASFTDDLSEVLDDATWDDNVVVSPDVGEVAFAEPTLSWSGPLASGESVTVTYTVTIDDPVEGNGTLENRITTPTGNCVEGSDDPRCTTLELLPELDSSKTADPDSARPGEVVTYTVTLTNTGEGDFTDERPATFSDDLTEVLDDAVYDDDAQASAGPAPAYAEPTLSWSGPIPAGETVTVTYSVTVDDPAAGDLELDNRIVTNTGNCIEGSEDPGCETGVGVYGIRFDKTADVALAGPGATVTYTVTATNTGQADFTDDQPASFTDDLSAVLTRASFDEGSVTASVGSTSYTAPRLTWSGPLAVGESATITYRVTVNDPVPGPGVLDNVVTSDTPGSNCHPAGTSNGEGDAIIDLAAAPADPSCSTVIELVSAGTPPGTPPQAPPPAPRSPITEGALPVTG